MPATTSTARLVSKNKPIRITLENPLIKKSDLIYKINHTDNIQVNPKIQEKKWWMDTFNQKRIN